MAKQGLPGNEPLEVPFQTTVIQKWFVTVDKDDSTDFALWEDPDA